MTNEQIITKAIEKAVAGGWKDGEYFLDTTLWKLTIGTYPPFFIWQHDFAKSLWGEKTWREVYGSKDYDYGRSPFPIDIPLYKARLAQMVIADDPIKYLGQNI